MASGRIPQAAGVAGLRNAVRFVWKETARGGREWFVKTVLIGGLKVDPGQVFCLQWNPSDNGYDLTMHSQVSYDRLMATCTAKAESEPFSFFKVEPLGERNVRIITVHMYNPYVGDAAVALYLGRYGKVDKPVKYLRDNYGIWSGRRQFRVLLGDDSESGDGLRHPPAYFTFGGERVFLFYSGQPSFCRQCRGFGHMASGCAQFRCRNCGGAGHGAASCAAPRACNGCGSPGHIFRDCPTRGRTYAAVAGEKKGPSFRPLEEGLQEIRGVEGPPPAAMAFTAAEAGQAAEAVLAVETVRTVEAVSGEEAAQTAEAVPAEGAVSAVEAIPADGVEEAARCYRAFWGRGFW